MTEERKIICDFCRRNLTYTSNSVDYSIRVINRRISPENAAVTDMMIYPPLENDLDFCGLICMNKFFMKENGKK